MNSFQINQEIKINASPEKVFAHLTNDITAWWDHGFSENPKAIILEPKFGGRFYEDMGEGDGVIYCQVMHVVKNKKLIMQGAMGMPGAVFGNIAFELLAVGSSTILKLAHHAFGDISADHKRSYTEGWNSLLGVRLKKLVETGASN